MRVFVAFVLLTTLASAQSTARDLLPTSGLSAEVRNLSSTWQSGNRSIGEQRKRARALRDRISQFVVSQLESKPSISARELQTQLRAVFDLEPWNNCNVCNDPPYVWATAWGSKTTHRQIVVAYDLSLGFMGPQSSLATIESYSWENGSARRTSRGGSELDGYVNNFDSIAWHPDTNEYWILAWGQASGASGRGLHGRALLYRVAEEKVEPVWRSSLKLDNVVARQNEAGWELTYADHDLLYSDDPHPHFIDVYSFDWTARTFRRIVHQRY